MSTFNMADAKAHFSGLVQNTGRVEKLAKHHGDAFDRLLMA